MKRKGRYQIWMTFTISCLFVILPCAGYGADLSIGNTVSTTGNWTVTGTISATFFAGDGSGLTNVTAAKWKVGSVAVVAKSGGDYTDPVTAMANLSSWCSNPTVGSHCLLKIMPGVYDVDSNTLQMQDYVDIEGAGETNTKITGKINSSTSGVVKGANAGLRFLTVENGLSTGGGSNAIAIYADARMSIKNVSANSSGGTNVYGIYIAGGNDTLMENVTALTVNGSDCYGIYSREAVGVKMTNVNVWGSCYENAYGLYLYLPEYYGCSEDIPDIDISHLNIEVSAYAYNAYGIYNSNYCAIIRDTKVVSYHGPIYNYGVFNTQGNLSGGGGSLTLIDVFVVAANITGDSGQGQYFGVLNTNTGGNITIDHSVIKASTNTVRNDNASATFRVGGTKLEGTGVAAGTLKCVGGYNANYDALDASCH
jgi:hypothetical protein